MKNTIFNLKANFDTIINKVNDLNKKSNFKYEKKYLKVIKKLDTIITILDNIPH